jgi:hypothetical protein
MDRFVRRRDLAQSRCCRLNGFSPRRQKDRDGRYVPEKSGEEPSERRVAATDGETSAHARAHQPEKDVEAREEPGVAQRLLRVHGFVEKYGSRLEDVEEAIRIVLEMGQTLVLVQMNGSTLVD